VKDVGAPHRTTSKEIEMTRFRNSLVASASLVCALWVGPVHAETYALVLEGTAGDIVVDTFESGTTQFTIGRLNLSGFGSPIEMMQGDDFSATVDILDGPMVVPGSPNQVFGFDVLGGDEPKFDGSPGAAAVMSGDITFYLEGEVVQTGGGDCSNCSFVAIFQAPGESFAFDRIEVTGQFLNLTNPYTIDSASFSYQLSRPVPEPATWALWLTGLGMAGMSVRRRAARAAGLA
jgi:hypothetical protein